MKNTKKCKYKLDSGVCELTGKNMKSVCFEWRCRSFEPDQSSEEEKEAKKSVGEWKPEYNQSRRTPTVTSTEVKARYNSKVYDRLTVTLPKGSAELLKAKAEEQGISVNQLIKSALVRVMPECIAYGGGGVGKTLKSIWAKLENGINL